MDTSNFPELPPGMVWSVYAGEPCVLEDRTNIGMITKRTRVYNVHILTDHGNWELRECRCPNEAEAMQVLATMLWTI